VGESIKANPRLWMEFAITVGVLTFSFIILALPTPDIVNQGAYQLCTLTLGYWFGRGSALYQERRRDNGNGG
jgi:dipeptide/tripeptide permease